VRLQSDDWTFRPTVLVRRGSSQGSGTIIASVDRVTLVATAAHVLRGDGPIAVELHRYNLGLENQPGRAGPWPRVVQAEIVGSDLSADVAILRIRRMIALPYTARLQPEDEEPASRADLTSVGIDLGSRLSSWGTSLVKVSWFELNESGADRPFLITNKIPEHGRSGGGLFDSRGRLVAVCVGHAELVKGRRMGIFSSIENVRQLLREHELTAVVARSESRRPRNTRPVGPTWPQDPAARPAFTPTEASREDPARKP
jgi:S1-C subfamily serine protease